MTRKGLAAAVLALGVACALSLASEPPGTDEENAKNGKTVTEERTVRTETRVTIEKTAPDKTAPAEAPKAAKPAAPVAAPAPAAANEWWPGGPAFRLPIEVKAAGYERIDKPVEVDLDFTEVFASLGRKTALNDTSLRLVEVDEKGAIVDHAVGFQFDRADGYGESTRARGTLVFLMKGTTPAKAARRFQVYFDLGGTAAVPFSMHPMILRHESVLYEGQASYKIVTSGATYFYHTKGGALASLLDLDDNDWISYHTGGGPAGDYRGIPDLAATGGYFQPGGNQCESAITRRGPVKLTITSESTDRRWAARWEIFPRYARLTVLKAARPYWFLYAGTPGGKLDEAKDFVVRSTGEKTPLSQAWTEASRGPQWVFFSSGQSKRALYLVRHEADALPVTCRAMDGSMVLFGFGRKGADAYLQFAPRHFTIGFADDAAVPAATRVIESAWRPLAVTVGQGEAKYPPPAKP